MSDAPSESTSSPRGQAIRSYLDESRRPLTSLAFVLPLVAVYEGGVILLGPHQAVRNGADVLLRQFLDRLGLGQYFLLPILTVGILLAWHHTTHEPWRVSPGVLTGMVGESAVWALILVEIGRIESGLFQSHGVLASVAWHTKGFWPQLIGFVGAGFYEEVLFRLLLLPLVAYSLKLGGCNSRTSIAGSVLATSLAFSAAHYIGAQGDAFGWFSFFFRFSAGAFFAVLFVTRGFGVAAGTHALYDIFVGFL